MSKKQTKIRFALIPHPGCSCEHCLMIGSRGFAFKEPFSPHKGRKLTCKCEFMAGIPGETKVEGFSEDRMYDEWQAVSTIRKKLGLSQYEFTEIFGASEAEGQIFDKFLSDQKAESVLDKLRKIRKFGLEDGERIQDYIHVNAASVKDKLEKASRFIPADWLVSMKNAGISAELYTGDRCLYSKKTKTLYINSSSDEFTVLHEMMHAMDDISEEFFEDSKRYFEKRTKGKNIRLLSELTKNDKYKDNEFAYDVGENCIDPYVFKIYLGKNGEYEYFELSSMGMEYLFRNTYVFAKDYDMLLYVLRKIWRF